jgi:hypothetical protein
VDPSQKMRDEEKSYARMVGLGDVFIRWVEWTIRPSTFVSIGTSESRGAPPPFASGAPWPGPQLGRSTLLAGSSTPLTWIDMSPLGKPVVSSATRNPLSEIQVSIVAPDGSPEKPAASEVESMW